MTNAYPEFETGLTPAPTEAIERYERTVGTTFQPDDRRFLETVNGINLVWQFDDVWDRSDAFFDVVREARRAAGGDDWGFDIRHVLGLGTGREFIELPAADGHNQVMFYDLRLFRHGYLVGVDPGGNSAVQVAEGSRTGQIKMLDHETTSLMYMMFEPDELADDERAMLPEDGSLMTDADAFWTFFEEDAPTVSDGFGAWLERNVAVQRAAMAAAREAGFYTR